MKKLLKIFAMVAILLFESSYSLKAQAPSNITLFFQYVDSTATAIAADCDTSINYGLNFNSVPLEGGLLKLHLIAELGKRGVKIIPDASSNKIFYSIENARVDYGKPFRKAFLGSFFAERTITLKGNYAISIAGEKIRSDTFSFANKDSIYVENLRRLETPSLSFTRGIVPDPPFFSSLVEPIIAIGAIVISIYLLFSVRSK